jgi:ABC-type multidrug transport system fused ATPase/permease subunit
LLDWGGAVLALGAVQAVTATWGDRLVLPAMVGSGYDTLRLVTSKVCDLGAAVERRLSTGDLVTVGVSDITLIRQAMWTTTRGAGGVTGFAVVAALLLTASWPVGLVVLLGVPLILLVTTRASRLLRRRQDQMRTRQRELTDQAVDVVRGLRVLRGFGGEEIFGRRYRAGSQELRRAALRQARATALLGAATTFLPGLLLVAVVTLAAEFVLSGRLSAGQLVACYGYATFLTVPVNRMTNAVSQAARAHVAAEHITRLLRALPDAASPPDPAPLPPLGADLADPASGLRVPGGALTAVVCSPGDTAALSGRLGGYAGSAAEGSGRAAGGAAYGSSPLDSLPLDGVRARIVVADGDARLFAGPLRRELDPAGRLACAGTDVGLGADAAPDADAPLWDAIDAAAARDIIEALPDGLDTVAAAGGQGFSGGQQQRLRLARALMADPDALILIDPASAVDAHTEAAMAAGIAARRRGRTTVVFTTSVLLLGHADHVALVIDGAVAAEGTHASLLGDPRYRAAVGRGLDGDEPGAVEPGAGERGVAVTEVAS